MPVTQKDKLKSWTKSVFHNGAIFINMSLPSFSTECSQMHQDSHIKTDVMEKKLSLSRNKVVKREKELVYHIPEARHVSRFFILPGVQPLWAVWTFWRWDSFTLGLVEVLGTLLWKLCTLCAVCFQKLGFLAVFEVWSWRGTIKTRPHKRFFLIWTIFARLAWMREKTSLFFPLLAILRSYDLFNLFLCDPNVELFVVHTGE